MCTVSPRQTEKSMVGSMMSIMETFQPARLMMPMVIIMLRSMTRTGARTALIPFPSIKRSTLWMMRHTATSLSVSLAVMRSLS